MFKGRMVHSATVNFALKSFIANVLNFKAAFKCVLCYYVFLSDEFHLM